MGIQGQGQKALSTAGPEFAGRSQHQHNPAPEGTLTLCAAKRWHAQQGPSQGPAQPMLMELWGENSSGTGGPGAHLSARKFCLPSSSLARDCAQPSVSLLLNKLEGSERATWRQGTAGSAHPSPGQPLPAGQESPCTLQPCEHPPSPSRLPAAAAQPTHASFCSASQCRACSTSLQRPRSEMLLSRRLKNTK